MNGGCKKIRDIEGYNEETHNLTWIKLYQVTQEEKGEKLQWHYQCYVKQYRRDRTEKMGRNYI